VIEGEQYKFQSQVWSKGKCIICGRRGEGVTGTMMNTGIARSVKPAAVSVSFGPYCKGCGGRCKVEMEILMKANELAW
jgi:hypothetical protein